MLSIPNFVTNCTVDRYSGEEANFLVGILLELVIVGILCFIYFIFKTILESKMYCITNKRITFTYNIFNIYKKNGSYRFEEIDDVIATDVLGLNNIIIKFKQGHLIDTPSIYKKDKKIKLKYVLNYDYTYGKLVEILNSAKNEQEVLWEAVQKNVEEQITN